MAFKKPTHIAAWSYSRYSTHRNCPLKAKLTIIDKFQEPKNAAMERGTEIHTLSEDYLKGKLSRLPKELSQFKDEFKRLMKKRKKFPGLVVVEEMWIFRKDWTETVWNDWDGAWVRVKLDVAELTEYDDHIEIMITDVKTGKFSQFNIEDYKEQLDLYRLSALLKYGNRGKPLKVRSRLMYVDHGITFPEEGTSEDVVVTLDDLKRLQKDWANRVKPMLNDRSFPPKPNRWCTSCHFRANNIETSEARFTGGGKCKF